MASPAVLKKLLNENQALKKECEEYKQKARNQTNFNRKLCSENRRRRLTNNQLKKQEQDRLIQLEMTRGSTQELKKLVLQLQKSLEEKDKQMMDWQDEVLILKTELTKQNKLLGQLEDKYKLLERRFDEKCSEYDILFNKSYKEAKTSKITPKGADFDEQLMPLINENCELQKKVKEMKQNINQYLQRIRRFETQIKEMSQEIETKNEIISLIINQNQKQPVKPIKPIQPIKPIVQKQAPIMEQFLNKMLQMAFQEKEQKPIKNISQRFQKPSSHERLRFKVQEYCKGYQHLLYSNENIQNIFEQPVTVNYCQCIPTTVQGIWRTRIRIAAEGELYFGLADARFYYNQVMKPTRNFIYYNNCTGSVVINKEGKIAYEYAHKGDCLQIEVCLKKDSKIIKFSKNNKQFHVVTYPECFRYSQVLYPFIKLFKYMGVDLC